MIISRVDPETVLPEALGQAVEVLARGGIVAFPTETFYGLAADPRSARAVAKVFVAKRRPPDQPLPLVAADTAQIEDHVGILTPLARRLGEAFWPGPLTLVIPASHRLCADVHLSRGTVAVRVPAHPVARALAQAAGHAITSTSANVSGKLPPDSPGMVADEMGEALDLLIDAGRVAGGRPSTIVDATGEVPALIRAGAVAWERVLEFLR